MIVLSLFLVNIHLFPFSFIIKKTAQSNYLFMFYIFKSKIVYNSVFKNIKWHFPAKKIEHKCKHQHNTWTKTYIVTIQASIHRKIFLCLKAISTGDIVGSLSL